MRNRDSQINQVLQFKKYIINMFKKIDEKMISFTKELESINKSQMEILKLNNAITQVRNSREY